jgi:hypothetical protein
MVKKHFGQLYRALALLVAVLLLALGAVAAGCSPQEDQTMTTLTTTLTQIAIPALDAAAPAHVETATFALG